VAGRGRVRAIAAIEVTSWGIAHVEVVRGDLLGWEAPAGRYDAAVCRWVLMFLPDPAAVIRRAFTALRPGGALGVLEYFPFLDIALEPGDEIFDRIYRAVARLIRDAGGDPDVGSRVPAMLQEAGFTAVEARAIRRSDAPASPLWEWIVDTGENHRNLVENGLITADDLARYYALLEDRERREMGRFIAPTVQSIVARKP
jgi:SAM-dependent methyltransferase